MKNHNGKLLLFFSFVLIPSVQMLAQNNSYLGDESGDAGKSVGSLTLLENDGKHGDDNTKNHILMFHPWGTKSHMGQLKVLVKGLLESGNSVTGVFVRKTGIQHDDYVELIVEDG